MIISMTMIIMLIVSIAEYILYSFNQEYFCYVVCEFLSTCFLNTKLTASKELFLFS